MLDINLIRKNLQIVKDNLKKRNESDKIKWVDDLLKKDKEFLDLKKQGESLRHRRNIISLKINELKKQGVKATKEITEAKKLPKKIESLEKKQNELREKINFYLMRIPNLSDKSVPFGKDEKGNKEIRKEGKPTKFTFQIKGHAELLENLNLADFEKAAEVSGTGFNYLIGNAALLDQALLQFAIDSLLKKDYTLVKPPLMLRRKPYEGAAPLQNFEDMMYKIDNEDLYLIATAEHPIATLHQKEILNKKDLPLKYMGVSPCFRREIGAHGIDQKGLFRVHQFYKVEQFIFCEQKDSWKFFEELIKNTEEIFKKLNLPYRIVNICTGDIGRFAAKQYDLEIWSPRQKNYIEAVSCSNCTDYQTRRLNIKYLDGKEKKYVHTLNATAIATSRALVALIENNQQKDGTVKIPTVLQKYLNLKKLEKR